MEPRPAYAICHSSPSQSPTDTAGRRGRDVRQIGQDRGGRPQEWPGAPGAARVLDLLAADMKATIVAFESGDDVADRE